MCLPQGLLGSANDVAFSSDGRRLLGAGGDKRLLVWNTGTGQVRCRRAHVSNDFLSDLFCPQTHISKFWDLFVDRLLAVFHMAADEIMVSMWS